MNRIANTLTSRLVLGVVCIHALLIPALFGGLAMYVNNTFRSAFINQVRTDAQLFSWLAGEDMAPARLEGVLFEGMLSSNLVFARVADASGAKLAQLAAPGVTQPFTEDFFFNEHGDDIYFIAVPVINETATPVGTLYLGYDETPTRELITLVNQRSAYLAIGYAALTLCLVIFWSRRLTRPLQQLQQLSRQVASGKFREPLAVDSRLTEISALAHDLNVMRQELVRKTESMQHLALHDTLTGLPNRTLLEDRLCQAIASARRERRMVALVVIDLDHFKEINDTLGHVAGDRVLQQTAERLQGVLRATDTVARLGGDEFAIVLAGVAETEITSTLEKICQAMHEPLPLGEQSFHVGLSSGAALYPTHGENFETLLQHADTAMYAAKKQRKDCVFYDTSLEAQNVDKLLLATELRRDMNSHALHAYYQPVLALPARRVVGYEALARWHHPEKGLLLPDVFVPLADKLGLIGGLTINILSQALEEYQKLPAAGGEAFISVNLSARLIQEDDFPRVLERLLEQFGMPAERLTLEITENEVMVDPARALLMLRRLRALGVHLAIDDFGTGYSSLEYLKNLPVDAVKIDTSFVWEMTRNPRDAKIVRAIIALCHTLEIRVYAEGVQDEETLDALCEAGCDFAQGFLISEPLPLRLLDVPAEC